MIFSQSNICHFNVTIMHLSLAGTIIQNFIGEKNVSKRDSYYHCYAHDHDQKSILPTKCHRAQHDIFMTDSKFLVSCKLKSILKYPRDAFKKK